jgi:hypothetical protein
MHYPPTNDIKNWSHLGNTVQNITPCIIKVVPKPEALLNLLRHEYKTVQY